MDVMRSTKDVLLQKKTNIQMNSYQPGVKFISARVKGSNSYLLGFNLTRQNAISDLTI